MTTDQRSLKPYLKISSKMPVKISGEKCKTPKPVIDRLSIARFQEEILPPPTGPRADLGITIF